MTIITRFAPSPTGHLHLGHAYASLFAWRAARQSRASFILRIEDIDKTRCRKEFETAIMEDLRWLGLEWLEPVRRQSRCMDDYSRALFELDHLGLVYPCFCSRKDIGDEITRAAEAPHMLKGGQEGAPYPGTCRRLAKAKRTSRMEAGEPHAWRLDMEKAIARAGKLTWHDREKGLIAANPRPFGDIVLARKDIKTSYHLACAVDDHLQSITLATRGIDLFASTHVHRLLQALLSLNTPEYHHHRLLLDKDGKRLAKRDGAKTIRHWRETGKSPEEIIRMAESN